MNEAERVLDLFDSSIAVAQNAIDFHIGTDVADVLQVDCLTLSK